MKVLGKRSPEQYFDLCQKRRHTNAHDFVVLTCGKQSLYVDPTLLKTHSSFFTALLGNENWLETKERRVNVVDTPFPILKKVVQYLETDQLNLEPKDVAETFNLAEQWDLIKVKALCVKLLKQHITMENYSELLESSYPDFVKEGIEFVVHNFERVTKSAYWIKIRREHLFTVLRHNSLNIKTELRIFKNVYRWAVVNSPLDQPIRDTFTSSPSLLDVIHFHRIDRDRLFGKVDPLKILTDTELLNACRQNTLYGRPINLDTYSPHIGKWFRYHQIYQGSGYTKYLNFKIDENRGSQFFYEIDISFTIQHRFEDETLVFRCRTNQACDITFRLCNQDDGRRNLVQEGDEVKMIGKVEFLDPDNGWIKNGYALFSFTIESK